MIQIFLNSLDGVRNSRLEVGWQVVPAYGATSTGLNAALETRQTEDVLAGQDGRLGELHEANRAREAEPLENISREVNYCTVERI